MSGHEVASATARLRAVWSPERTLHMLGSEVADRYPEGVPTNISSDKVKTRRSVPRMDSTAVNVNARRSLPRMDITTTFILGITAQIVRAVFAMGRFVMVDVFCLMGRRFFC